MSYWRDEDWQELLLTACCRDRNFLKKVGHLLSPEDFKPRKGEGLQEAYWIAQKAFEYWRSYRDPIGGFLKTDMLDYIRANKRKMGGKQREKLLEIVEHIRKSDGLVAPEAIEKKVLEYKRRQARTRAVKQLIELQEKGELDDRKYIRILKEAVDYHDETIRVSHYEDELEKRISRRDKDRDKRFPYLFIDPLDKEVRTFPRGLYGIILAKYKIGKSHFAVHIAQAYAMQNLNVMLVTLEDPAEQVEDRLDSSFTGIKIKHLYQRSNKLRRRLKKALQKVRGKIRVVDGVDNGLSVGRIEEIWENFRNQGWTADVVIVDSDEHIIPPEHYKSDSGERRESIEIHKEFKKFVARRDLYGWMMAQATRGKSGKRKMIITGDDSATDISKMRRCVMCIGVGDGPDEWGDDGRYLNIAAHRLDKQRCGWPIMGDFERSIFYDREATEEAMISYNKKKN